MGTTVAERSHIFVLSQIARHLPLQFDMNIDDTFGVTQVDTRQMLIILVPIRGRTRPVAWISMASKTQAAYEHVFAHLRNASFCVDGIDRTPQLAMADFETALRNGVTAVWPGAQLSGSAFHFIKALVNHALQDLNLWLHLRNSRADRARRIRINDELPTDQLGNHRTTFIHHHIIAMFSRLNLLPLHHINKGLVVIERFIDSQILAVDFAAFKAYFRRQWMRRVPPAEWCVSHLERRTNNNSEGNNAKKWTKTNATVEWSSSLPLTHSRQHQLLLQSDKLWAHPELLVRRRGR